MQTTICSRCGKPVGILNQVYIEGKIFGTECAADIKRLLHLKSIHPELKHLCKGSQCTSCRKTFHCPLKTALDDGCFQLDIFSDDD